MRIRILLAILSAAIGQNALADDPSSTPRTVAAAQCRPPATSAGGVSNTETRYVETTLLPALTGSATKPVTLAARMRALNMAGVSVAVFHGGRIAWARGWGVRDAATCQPVTAETLFQAASNSKTLAALLAMRQVERGTMALDRDINRSLKRWQLPRDDKFPPGTVTLRQLLNHTGGTSVGGFMGYAPDLPRPDLVQILNGSAPANSAPIRIERKPGEMFTYSGGGYTIIQAALEDVSGRGFAELAQTEILTPVGMTRSRFAQPATPDMLTNIATGHDKGNPFAAKAYVYPELAAAGLWTTPSDLARLLIDVQAAASGKTGHIVTPQTAVQMLTPGAGDWGLGYATWNTGHDKRFGHFGGNLGFVSEMWSFADRGEGIVILTNGESGLRLADDIIRAVANRRGWTEFASKPMASAIKAVPIFLRGSMNDWSTGAPMIADANGNYAADITLQPGDFEFKIASGDWNSFVLGREDPTAIKADNIGAPLSPSGGNIALKIGAAGRYRFVVRPDATGNARLSISPVVIP